MPGSKLNTQDTKSEYIDVDAMFDGVEMTESRSAAKARLERKKSERRIQGRAPTGFNQHPINLLSDEDDVPPQSSSSGRQGTAGAGANSKRVEKGKEKERRSQIDRIQGPISDNPHAMEGNAYSRSVPTSLQRLKRAPTVGPSNYPIRIAVPYNSSRRPKNVTVIEDSDVEMDIDEPSTSKLHALRKIASTSSTTYPGSAIGHESDYSLDSPPGFAEVELKEDLDDVAGALAFIDLHAMLGLVEGKQDIRKADKKKGAPPRVSSRVMSRHETSGTWIQAKDRHRRIWDAPANAYPTSLHKAFEVDLPKRIVRKELVSRYPSSWPRHAPSLNCGLTATPLRLVSPQYKKTSGSITKIAQSHGHIAVASATSGGQPDAASDPSSSPQIHPEIDPYNTDGNLLVWTGKEFFDLKAHTRTWILNSQQRSKVYTVNDVAFDPQKPGRLVSSGNDCIVHVWDLQNLADGSFEPRPLNHLELHYSGAPHDIAFKPNSSVFAVSCSDGNVHVHSENEHNSFQVVFDRSTSSTGAFLWGGYSDNQKLSNMLFASSESENDKAFCKHAAFDVERRKEIYSFKVDDSGDSMALNPKGDTLALVTSTSEQHMLTLFDVARGDGRKSIAELSLPPHVHVPGADASAGSLEVSFSAFSPDGVFIALARSDNVTLVYDARFLGDGRPGGARPWACLRHPRRGLIAGLGYGMTGLHWVNGLSSVGLGLVTAASDGCVRLWDVMHAPSDESQSLIIAEVDHDVACFSVGDHSRNERKLIVGDGGGEIYIFD